MRYLPMMLALSLSACGREAEAPPAEPGRADAVAPATAPQSAMPGKGAGKQMAMIEVPADKAQLQRLVAMGYTVHEEHLHPPGVKECPFDMGGGVVQ